MEFWKDNERRSRFLVVLALAIYSLLLGITIGAAPTSWPGNFESLDAMEFWIHRYQTLLGAAFVILTIVVGLDQIRESRRQHEQSARLAFLPELSALNHAEMLARRIEKESTWVASFLTSWVGKQPDPTDNEIEALATALDSTVAPHLRTLGDAIAGKKIPKPTGGALDALIMKAMPLQNEFDADKAYAARNLLAAIEARRGLLRLFITGI